MTLPTSLKSMTLWVAFLIVYFTMPTPDLVAQEVFNPFPCVDANRLDTACAGRRYEIDFEVQGAPGTWSVVSGAAGSSINAGTGLFSWILPPAVPVGNSYSITIRAAAAGPTKVFTLPVVASGTPGCPAAGITVTAKPCIQEIVYVLDASGSMNDLLPNGDSRWQSLQTNLQSHINSLSVLEPGLDINDTWTAALFGDGVTRVTKGNFFNNITSTTVIPTGTPANGWTPMGAGLHFAYSQLFTGLGQIGQGKRRMLVLLTDGEQNRNPYVEMSPLRLALRPGQDPPNGEIMTDITNPPRTYPAIGNTVYNLEGVNAAAIRSVGLYAVDIGANSTQVEATLSALATNSTSGDAVGSLDAARIADFFDEAAQEWLNTSSPRILDKRNGNSRGFDNPGVEAFTVNDSVHVLTLKFYTSDQLSTSAQVSVTKNGVFVNPTMIKRVEDHTVLVQFNFAKDTSLPSPAGQWVATFWDFKPNNYNVAAFVEDKMIHHDLKLGNGSKLYAGDDLNVKFNVDYRGVGMDGDTVQAFLLRPGDDLGDLVAKAPPVQAGQTHLFSSSAQAKFDFYALDGATLLKMKDEERIITLQDDGNGNYSGVFKGNEVTGIYEVFIRAKGTHPYAKKWQGWTMEGAFFDFSRPEDITLQREIIDLGNGQYTVRVTPVNKFGRRMGPGQEDRIRFTTNPGTLSGFTDKLDGTYETTLTAPVGTNPVISIFVIDQLNPVSVAPIKPQPWGVSLHAGAAIPLDNFGILNKPGVMAEIDLTYRISERFDIEALGGYYGFSNANYIAGASILVGYKVAALSPNLSLRAAIGAGYFKPKNDTATVGYTGRLELVRSFGAHWQGTLHGAYFRLPDPNISFAAVGIGMKYFF